MMTTEQLDEIFDFLDWLPEASLRERRAAVEDALRRREAHPEGFGCASACPPTDDGVKIVSVLVFTSDWFFEKQMHSD